MSPLKTAIWGGGTLALLLGALLVMAVPAAAHVPFLEPDRRSDAPAQPGDAFPGAVVVPDASISRAIYGTLAEDGLFDAWELKASKATTAPVEMLVPARDEYQDFRPSFALVGPGLETQGDTPDFITDRLADAYPDDRARDAIGVIVVDDPGQEPRPTFYEPFSFTTYFEGGKTTVDLEPNVTYHLVVYDNDGATGEYALGVARAERFTASDAIASVGAVVRIKLGLYGQGAFHPGAAAVLVLAVAAAVLLIVLLVRWMRRRRGRG